MGGFIMTIKTRDLDNIKLEFAEYYVNSLETSDLIDMAKRYLLEYVEDLKEDEFKRHLFDNVDEYIYDDLKAYVQEKDPSKAYQMLLEIHDDREVA